MEEILQPQRMTKRLITKYNKICKNTYRLEFNVRTQKEFDKLRILALLTEVINEEDIETFFKDVFHDYFPVNPVLAPFEDGVWDTLGHQMKGYFSFAEQEMWDLWYMYTYNYVMNYTYNSTSPGYAATFSNMLDTALKKFVRVANNKAVEQTRTSMAILEQTVKDNPPQVKRDGRKLTMHLTFVWQSREDKKVCKHCDALEGQTLLEIPQMMPHLNCRCDFVVYEWWTDEDGNVVADRSYEVEQNKYARGKGFSVKQNKVTSKLVDGEQITLFEVMKDGKTTKKTYKK